MHRLHHRCRDAADAPVRRGARAPRMTLWEAREPLVSCSARRYLQANHDRKERECPWPAKRARPPSSI